MRVSFDRFRPGGKLLREGYFCAGDAHRVGSFPNAPRRKLSIAGAFVRSGYRPSPVERSTHVTLYDSSKSSGGKFTKTRPGECLV